MKKHTFLSFLLSSTFFFFSCSIEPEALRLKGGNPADQKTANSDTSEDNFSTGGREPNPNQEKEQKKYKKPKKLKPGRGCVINTSSKKDKNRKQYKKETL